MDLGGWIYGADHQGLVPTKCGVNAPARGCGDGWAIDRAEVTSGESYQENGIASVTMTKREIMYSCCPAPFPVLSCVTHYSNPRPQALACTLRARLEAHY